MSQFHPTDPLLLAGKVVTILMQFFMALGALALTIAIPLLLIFGGRIDAELAKELGEAAGAFPLFPTIGLLFVGLAIVISVFIFFDKLRRIIGTVGEGDPFAPVNADRLSMMAWLLLGVQILMLPAAGLGLMLAKWADKVDHADVNIDAGLDLTGILMVLVLFILARVFRHGAAMREDLEGTV
ncbi:MAG: DUF2975 domain-containing protein [Sphingomonadaceae bacterium]|nr:DUF2975 domain-containing protein [Sphingomonadaceae bacterium]MCP5393102.1 DUF2975 domain-containing protein [Sphingomonadaceae bacterium]